MKKVYSDEISKKTDKIETRMIAKVSKLNVPIKNKMDRIEKDILDIKRDSLIASALEHKKLNQVGYILNLTQVLEMDIDRNWDWRINKSVRLLLECLDSFNPDLESLNKLQLALDKMSPEYELQVGQIKSKMGNILADA